MSASSSQTHENHSVHPIFSLWSEAEEHKADEDMMAGLEDEQRKQVEELERAVHSHNPELKHDEYMRRWLNKRCLRRYLVARQWKHDQSLKMINNSIEWFQTYQPHMVSPHLMESQIRHGHMYSRCFDKHGHPACMLRVHTVRDPHTNEQKLQFMVYSMMKAIHTMDPHVEKMNWLVCLTGYNMKYNGEIGFAKSLLDILSNHFPERLYRVYLFDVPFMFRMFWKMISPFCDEKTREKFVFVPSGQEKALMESEFDLSTLETTFGGTEEYTFDPDSYFASCVDLWDKFHPVPKVSKNSSERKKRRRKKKKKQQEAKGGVQVIDRSSDEEENDGYSSDEDDSDPNMLMSAQSEANLRDELEKQAAK